MNQFIEDEAEEARISSSESEASTETDQDSDEEKDSDFNSSPAEDDSSSPSEISSDNENADNENAMDLKTTRKRKRLSPSDELLQLHEHYNAKTTKNNPPSSKKVESAELANSRKPGKSRVKPAKLKGRPGEISTTKKAVKHLDEDDEEKVIKRKKEKIINSSARINRKKNEDIETISDLNQPTKIKDLHRETGDNAYSHKITLPKNACTFTLEIHRQGMDKLKTNYLFNCKKEIETTAEGVQIMLLK